MYTLGCTNDVSFDIQGEFADDIITAVYDPGKITTVISVNTQSSNQDLRGATLNGIAHFTKLKDKVCFMGSAIQYDWTLRKSKREDAFRSIGDRVADGLCSLKSRSVMVYNEAHWLVDNVGASVYCQDFTRGICLLKFESRPRIAEDNVG